MRRSTTALWVVAALVVFELVVRNLPAHWFDNPISAQRRLVAVREVVLHHLPESRIVVLGSSRSAYGVMPKLVDEVRGLPPRSAVIASCPGLELWECVQADRDSRSLLRKASPVIFSSDEFFLFRTRGPASTRKSFRDVPSWDRQVRYVLDTAFSFREKLHWALYRARIALGVTSPFRLNWEGHPVWGLLLSPGWLDEVAPLKQPDLDAIVDSCYAPRTVDPRALDPLRLLAAKLREDGCRFVVMQMLNNTRHQDQFEKKFGAQFRAHSTTMADLCSSLGGPFHLWRRLSTSGRPALADAAASWPC